MIDSLLADYQQLLAQRSLNAARDDTEELLQLMDAETAEQLRLCAIPHQFDPEILQVLLPELSRDEVEARCDEFSKLSIIVPTDVGWTLHDETRKELFNQWLLPERAEMFVAASSRLAAYFEAISAHSSGDTQETARRRRMYHLTGVNQEQGFTEFETLFQRARGQRRFSECASLIRLMHEYDSVLIVERGLWLAYYEGKLALDQMAWDEAERLSRQVLAHNSTPFKLKVNACIQLGVIFNQKHEWQEAIRYFDTALKLALDNPASMDVLPDIFHHLGAAYRDLAALDQAENFLNKSIKLATQNHNLAAQANAYNSLGTLKLRHGDNGEAIEAFNNSLDCLKRSGDVFRTAQVFNNLGIAYRNLRDWEKSEQFFQKSLEIKQQAGDSLGRALALTNLALVKSNRNKLDEAISTTTQAVALFEDMHDFYNAAIALQNRGKYYLKQKNTNLAKDSFLEAIQFFARAGKADEASTLAKEIESIDKKPSLPWWAWLAFGLLAAATVIIVMLLSRFPLEEWEKF